MLSNINRKFKFIVVILLIFFVNAILPSLNIYSNDIHLKIPYIQYRENSWAAACMTMMFQYYDRRISLKQVVSKCGHPPILDYVAVDNWLREHYEIRLIRYDNKTINDIMKCIDLGSPVMILQQHSIEKKIDATRIITGYNRYRKEFIIKEPTNSGKEYRMSFETFQILWDSLPDIVPGWPLNFFWTVIPAYFDNDVMLKVPFEPNRGETCASSSMTMIINYWGRNVKFKDVSERAGMPPVIDYDNVDRWLRNSHNLKLISFNEKTLNDIIACIDNGYPVMVLQQFLPNQKVGHNRVVIGYNMQRGEFILNDPSELGCEYRMSFQLFQEMWDILPEVCPGWPDHFFWLIIPMDMENPNM